MSWKPKVHICSFDETLDLKGKRLTYEALKARVLEAGRFSAFEACRDDRARLFDRLYKEPDLIIDNKSVGYPWTLVRRREPAGETK